MSQDPDDLALAHAPSRPLGLRVLAGVGALAFALIAVNLAVVIVRMLLAPSQEPKPRPQPLAARTAARPLSAWMLAHRADESAFGAMGDVVKQYRQHWEGLVRDGVPADLLGGRTSDDLAARDEANRAAIFSPEVDPVWANVDRLIGEESSAEIRDLLRTAGRD